MILELHKASAILGASAARSGKFEFSGQMYTGIRVLSRDLAYGIKDVELSYIKGVAGDAKAVTRRITGADMVGVMGGHIAT